MTDADLRTAAIRLLKSNSKGNWTPPTSVTLYPHQWLWDSFFIAIGQRHFDLDRAAAEIDSPFRAQWSNGMVPHIIFDEASNYHAGPELWKTSKMAPAAPRHLETTGVTQPPMAAEATVRVGRLMDPASRRQFYARLYPKILRWHQMLYRERDPRGDGLVELFLSWESGMDDSPPLMEMLHRHAMSRRVQLMKATRLDRWAERRRRDTNEVPATERIATLDLHAIYDLIRNMRARHYDYHRIRQNHPFRVVDLLFNCVLMRANEHLAAIAAELGEKLPPDIARAMQLAPHTLESHWDEASGFYYPRDAVSGELIKLPSVATFLPLYAADLPAGRVQRLLDRLADPATFATTYPVPSAPLNSSYFDAHRYWQGPTWINVNWLIIDGLVRQGRTREAERLRQSTLEVVRRSVPAEGFHEYYSPLDGSVAGAPDFSWTAALTIDLLASTP